MVINFVLFCKSKTEDYNLGIPSVLRNTKNLALQIGFLVY